MPTSRKRIGFLPTAEVKNIIDKISAKNNLSQSKVTGILVEEALKARNLIKLKSNENKEEKNSNYVLYKSTNKSKGEIITNKINKLSENNEYKLIKEYLDYKNFKKILSIVESESLDKL